MTIKCIEDCAGVDCVDLIAPALVLTRPENMTIIITAFERSPDGGKGLAPDTRVRWKK